MKLSLVTGTVNRPEQFARLVRSIVEHTSVDWELVVSDASEVTNVCDDPRVRILEEKPRLGYVKGYNRAMKHVRGEWVIWLNDDAEVLPGYDTAAIEYMESHPKIGLGCLAFRDRLWPDEFRVCSFWHIPYANFGIIRKELGDQIGWFWEELRMYGSDNAITFEVLLRGKGVAAILGEFIHHHRPEDDVREQNQIGRQQDNRRLQDRYQPCLQSLRLAYFAGLT